MRNLTGPMLRPSFADPDFDFKELELRRAPAGK